MSKLTIADIYCDQCGHKFEIQVYSSVNVKHNPELRQKILDGTFFKHECPSCGHIIDSFYEILYHDMDKRFMIWLVKPDSANVIFMQQNSLKIAGILPDYKLNIARYSFQWIERIITLELGMDPRIVELYKFGEKEKQQLPLKTENDYLHFYKYTRNLIGRTVFHWNFVHNNGEIEHYSKTLDAKKYQDYENLIKNTEPILTATSWYLIDWQFPFGLEVHDNELVHLPAISDFIEIGESKSKLPSQFLDVVKRTGKGRKI